MKSVTSAEALEVFQELGLQSGDHLLVHSAIQYLGRPQGGVGMYFDVLCSILGIPSLLAPHPSLTVKGGQGRSRAVKGGQEHRNTATPQHRNTAMGTLAVPAFNFAFARGEPYDPQTTPSVGMGVFSEYVRQQPGVLRTSHPLQSIALIGRWAQELAGRDTPGAFDDGSAFDSLQQLDFKILLLGADIDAISMLHYCEQRAGVPYRYWKDFSGQVRTPTGWQERTYRMYVRDLDLDPRLTLHPVQEVLEKLGQWSSLPLNYGLVSALKVRDFVAAVDACLARDPTYLITDR